MVLVQFCLYLNAIFSVERPSGYNTSFFSMPNDIKKLNIYLRKQEVAEWGIQNWINSFWKLEKHDREIFVALWMASQVYPQHC